MFDFQSAEFSTVGALLIDGSCLELVRPVLPNGEAFGNPACRKAYEAICALADQGKPIDPVTVGRLSGLTTGSYWSARSSPPPASMPGIMPKPWLRATPGGGAGTWGAS